MKKKVVSLLTAGVLAALTLSACGQSKAQPEETNEAATEEAEATKEPEEASEESEETVQETKEEAPEDLAEAEEETSEEAEETEETEETEKSSNEEASAEEADGAEYEVVRVGSLKGPTTMGLVNLMNDSESGEATGSYEFTMATQPDEIVAGVVSGDLDIALVPANMAAVLYNKTEGGVSLVDINTLGVLYCVTGDESIKSVADLAGKTVITTGQGATPEYALNFLLEKNNVTDCTLEFKSEATEIAAILKEDSSKIAVLPQPFATVAQVQNDAIKTAFGLTDEWTKVAEDSQLITGVTIVRNEFLKDHAAEVLNFIAEHEKSAGEAVSDVEKTAELVASYGIIEKKEIAAKAIPECNIVCISGEEAKGALSGYLQTLFDEDPKSVGGALPADDFYDLSVTE